MLVLFIEVKKMRLLVFVLAIAIIIITCISAQATQAIVINEIMFDPNGTDSGREWIEIYNEGAAQLDISAYKLSESGSAHILNSFQGDLLLDSHEYAIIADDPNAFLLDYPDYEGTLIDSSFSLVNTGELLEILDENSEVIDTVFYNSSWGGGLGFSLELKNPSIDNSVGSNWLSSSIEKGTPGDVNSVFQGTSELPEYSWLTACVTLVAGLGILMFIKKK